MSVVILNKFRYWNKQAQQDYIEFLQQTLADEQKKLNGYKDSIENMSERNPLYSIYKCEIETLTDNVEWYKEQIEMFRTSTGVWRE